ncbi:MAG: DNA internalization-related competence protein ComEC/Rec2 [Betaproteobacteria bacterium RIFCSPLOWO2_12_FULL_68_20]|nr:MAG: DNA internalization-related competence protein ComEC/Rec2 [Betaproteobacteria bacterium RIFCSPLOWO2_12_FULL_68_20]
MTLAALAFAAGVLLLQLQAALPAPAWLLLIPAGAAAAFWKPALARRFAPAAALAAGFLWAAALAHLRMADWLAPGLEGRDLDVVGVVASLPGAGERSVRFEFDIESAEGGERLPSRVRLAWYRAFSDEEDPAILSGAVHPGERWLFTVRLRRPHGNLNPHGFDYEAWLLERGIGATGYVRARGEARKLGERNSLLDRVEQARESVRDRFLRTLGATPAAGVLAALAVGDQRAISNEEWRLFQTTGVTHLMSISGLHVTLVSGLAAWLAAALWRRVPRLTLALPARKAAAATAIAAALGYTLLAGFAVPAQRTFYMVTVVAAALWSGRIALPARALALALAAVVAADPWAPLAPGLWLSFGAVALIFYTEAGWTARPPRLAQWGRVQWAITVGLAPAALLLFGQASVAGPLANAIAIPLVSAVVTPLALLAAAVPFDAPLELAAWLVERLLEFLEWCASLPGALWQQHVPPLWSVMLALAGITWLLAPRGVPWRASGLALLAPALALPPAAPGRGEAWITALDVGQGLAVLVRTSSRALLFDAGPAFGAESDSGARIVVPYLRSVGLARLDAMVLSHDASDHIGGARSVLENFEVDTLASSLAARHPLHAFAPATPRCARGTAWEWDGVRFEFLHPAQEAGASKRRNDLSCVLRVAAPGGSMLLAGDIERAAEAALLERGGASLKANVVLVPHHGSRSSSSPEFVAAVTARWAVVSAGYRNRFGHPRPEVLERYRLAGTAILRTDLDGAVTVRLAPSRVEAHAERSLRARYWRAVPPV